MTEGLRAYSIAGDDGIILISIILFALFAFIIYRGKEALMHHWTLFFTNRKASGGESLSDNGTEVQNNLMLAGIWAISIGLLTFPLFSETADATPYGTIFAIAGIMVAYVLAKILTYAIVNWTFFEGDAGVKWVSAYCFLISLSSILLFPLALVKIFLQPGETFLHIGLLIVLVLYKILLFCKLCINFKYKKYGFLLIFLYFCTLELLPILVCWQIIM